MTTFITYDFWITFQSQVPQQKVQLQDRQQPQWQQMQRWCPPFPSIWTRKLPNNPRKALRSMPGLFDLADQTPSSFWRGDMRQYLCYDPPDKVVDYAANWDFWVPRHSNDVSTDIKRNLKWGQEKSDSGWWYKSTIDNNSSSGFWAQTSRNSHPVWEVGMNRGVDTMSLR